MFDSFIVDVIAIKTLEKEIGRPLDAMEMEVIYSGEPLWVKDLDDEWISSMITFYKFPFDLMPDESKNEIADEVPFFDFAFNKDGVVCDRSQKAKIQS